MGQNEIQGKILDFESVMPQDELLEGFNGIHLPIFENLQLLDG